jgi:two-component system chemotaxis response regulator CheV
MTQMKSVDERTDMAGKNRFEMLIFIIGGQKFGINVFKVREIIEEPSLSDMPGANESVIGIAYIRNEAMAVIDTSYAIGMGKSVKKEASKSKRFLIITEYNQSSQALLIDGIANIVNLNWSNISPPPSIAGKDCFLTSVSEVNGEMVGVLDVERILSDINQDDDKSEKMIIDESIGTGNKIIIVDDSQVAIKQVIRCVTNLGFEHISFKNGKEALSHLKELAQSGVNPAHEYIMMITDIEMPIMDGYTLTAEVKKDPELKKLTVVLHSSLSGVFNNAMVNTVGGDHFLPKYDPKELQNLISEITGKTAELAA